MKENMKEKLSSVERAYLRLEKAKTAFAQAEERLKAAKMEFAVAEAKDLQKLKEETGLDMKQIREQLLKGRPAQQAQVQSEQQKEEKE